MKIFPALLCAALFFNGVAAAEPRGFDFAAEAARGNVRTDAKRAEISDYMGNRTEVPVVDGEVEFVLDANPKALLLWDAERIFNFQFSIFNLQSSIFSLQSSIFNLQSSILRGFGEG